MGPILVIGKVFSSDFDENIGSNLVIPNNLLI